MSYNIIVQRDRTSNKRRTKQRAYYSDVAIANQSHRIRSMRACTSSIPSNLTVSTQSLTGLLNIGSTSFDPVSHIISRKRDGRPFPFLSLRKRAEFNFSTFFSICQAKILYFFSYIKFPETPYLNCQKN